MIKCPACCSAQIASFYDKGQFGYWQAANDLAVYPESLIYEDGDEASLDRPFDLDLYVCLNCRSIWHKADHKTVDNAPMSAAPFLYNEDGSINWRDMWQSFCALSLDGGPAHRGPDDHIVLDPKATWNMKFETDSKEIIRGIEETTSLKALQVDSIGNACIYVLCRSQEHAMWMAEAISAEGVEARQENLTCVAVPCNNDFTLNDIKSVITAVAKTSHYWDEHGALAVPPEHIARLIKPTQNIRDRYRK